MLRTRGVLRCLSSGVRGVRRAYLRLVVIVHQEDVVHAARALQGLEVEPAAHAARALARRDRPLHRRLEHREDQLEPGRVRVRVRVRGRFRVS